MPYFGSTLLVEYRQNEIIQDAGNCLAHRLMHGVSMCINKRLAAKGLLMKLGSWSSYRLLHPVFQQNGHRVRVRQNGKLPFVALQG